MGNVKAAAKAIKPAINYLIKMKCKKIILGVQNFQLQFLHLNHLKM